MYSRLKNRLYRLLRWSEQYMKTDMVYLAKGGFWMIAGQTIAAVAAFGLSVAFANLIPREAYGTYKYVLSVGAIIGALTLSGLGTYVTQSVGRGFEGALRYSFRLTLLWSIPIVLGAFSGAIYYALHGNVLLAYSLAIIGIATPFLNGAQLYSSYLGGRRDFRLASGMNVFISLFQAGAIFVALFLHASVLALVTTYFVANTVATFACYLFTLERFKPNDLFDRAMAHFSTRLSFANMALSFVGQLDKVLLFHFVGAGPVAVWSLAQAPVVQLRAALKLSTPLSLPKLATLDRETVAKNLQAKVNRFTAGIFVITIIYILAAPFLFRVFFPAYMDAVPYTQAYALILPLFPKKLLSLALYAQEERRGQYAFAITTPLAQLMLLAILVPWIGIWGAVLAPLGANLISNEQVHYYFSKFRRGE